MGYVSIISLDNSKKANLIYKMCGNNSRWTKRRNHSGIKLDLSIPYMVYSIPSKAILKIITIFRVIAHEKISDMKDQKMHQYRY